MNISIIIFILIFVYYCFLRQNEYDSEYIKKLVRFGCLLLILESGFRHVLVGPDTRGYYADFYDIMGCNWSDVISALFVDSYEFRDPGYDILTKAFSTIIPSWQLFLVATATLYYYAMGKLFVRYIHSCSGVLLAFTLVLSLFNIIALSGMRQMITIAVSMLVIPYIFEKRWKLVIPVILLSTLIHISALFIFAFIPFAYINEKTSHKLHLIAILLFPLVALSARSIVGYMASFIANDYYAGYATKEGQESVGTYVIVGLLMSIFIYFFYNPTAEKNKFPALSIPASVLMTLAIPLIILDGTMIRIGQYFTIYMMVTLPAILDVQENRKTFYSIMIFFLAYFILAQGGDYYFFWQDVPGPSFIYEHPFWGLHF